MRYDETRCSDKWEDSSNKEKLKENVINYAATRNITIYEMEIFIISDPETCYDCVCRTGRQYKCKIKSSDLKDAQAEGFYE